MDRLSPAYESLGKVELVADMLPSPEELAFKEDSVKVTISLSKSSVEFFKREAKKTRYKIPADDSTSPGCLYACPRPAHNESLNTDACQVCAVM